MQLHPVHPHIPSSFRVPAPPSPQPDPCPSSQSSVENLSQSSLSSSSSASSWAGTSTSASSGSDCTDSDVRDPCFCAVQVQFLCPSPPEVRPRNFRVEVLRARKRNGAKPLRPASPPPSGPSVTTVGGSCHCTRKKIFSFLTARSWVLIAIFVFQAEGKDSPAVVEKRGHGRPRKKPGNPVPSDSETVSPISACTHISAPASLSPVLDCRRAWGPCPGTARNESQPCG